MVANVSRKGDSTSKSELANENPLDLSSWKSEQFLAGKGVPANDSVEGQRYEYGSFAHVSFPTARPSNLPDDYETFSYAGTPVSVSEPPRDAETNEVSSDKSQESSDAPFQWQVGDELVDPSSPQVSEALYTQRTTLGLGKGDIGWSQVHLLSWCCRDAVLFLFLTLMSLQIVAKPPSMFVFDLETTGLSKRTGRRVTEIGIVAMSSGATFRSFVNPQMPIPPEVSAVTHIYDKDVKDAPIFSEIIPKVIAFIEKEAREHSRTWTPGTMFPILLPFDDPEQSAESIVASAVNDVSGHGLEGTSEADFAVSHYPLLLAHNGRSFAVPVLEEEFELCHAEVPGNWKFADTLSFARHALPFKATSLRGYKLTHLRKACGVSNLLPASISAGLAAPDVCL